LNSIALEELDPALSFEGATVVVPALQPARRVQVEATRTIASHYANLDAPARDADWIRQRRPQWLPGERSAVMSRPKPQFQSSSVLQCNEPACRVPGAIHTAGV
jgi:hypothetical protein